MARAIGSSVVAAGILALGVAGTAEAQDRRLMGLSITSSNDDFLAPTIEDRWRSGALGFRAIHGTGWPSTGPVGVGEVLDFTLHAEILSPADVDSPDPDDRPYATRLSFGVATHFRTGQTQIRVGAEAVVVGPQTGLSGVQESLHEWQNLPDPSAAADDQLGDAVYLTASAEAARSVALGRDTSLRPFVSARAGDETFARVGLDLVGGSLASGGLLVRDPVTGHLAEGTRGLEDGFAWSVGADVASVASSVYLPDDRGVEASAVRGRARAGLGWATGRWSAFFGTTYLTPEFEEQDEGQIVGALSLTMGF